jgi:hypothetical protein
MPVSAVFGNLEAGASIDEIVEQFDIAREQVNAILEFAARSLDAPGNSPVDAQDAVGREPRFEFAIDRDMNARSTSTKSHDRRDPAV